MKFCHEPKTFSRNTELFLLSCFNVPSSTSSVIRWIPPSDGIYKVNFDGAVFTELTIVSIGVTIRDSSGHIIATLSQKIRLPHSVDLVEAMVASRELTFASVSFSDRSRG
ncbi:hypothetical protein CFP56_031346 [Quercus suber]|uniref:RNase H type-1 domain-containing protein n=1 Tax=Quercus suber TaxID=58331 RepID=A0AAW0JM26_QUESU